MNSPVCILTGGRTRMKILLFGTGDYYNRYKKWFVRQDVTALLDNSRQKQHTIIDGLEVLSPEEGIRLDYDAIVILSFYVKQMKQQLLSLGVEPEKIYHFYDLHQFLRPGDCLVLNDSRVLPARLLGHREPSGGAAEVLLLIDKGEKKWEMIHILFKMHGRLWCCFRLLSCL